VPDRSIWPPPGVPNLKSVRVRVDSEYRYSRKIRMENLFDMTPHVVALLDDSRLFSNVTDDRSGQSADLTVYVRIMREYYSPWYNILVIFATGFLGPYRERWTVTVGLDVKGQKGEQLGTVTKSETETTLGGLLFVPIGLFTPRHSAMDLDDDVLRAAITEAHAKRLF